jgi:hypothetical protein
MFITLEDKTGLANLVVWPQVFERFRRVVMSASMIAVRGRIQGRGRWSTSSRIGSLIFPPRWRPSAAAMLLFRCRIDAAIKSPTPAAVPILGSYHPRACATVTSMFRTCTSTSLKRRAETSIKDGRRGPVRAESRGGGSRQNGVTELLVVERRCCGLGRAIEARLILRRNVPKGSTRSTALRTSINGESCPEDSGHGRWLMRLTIRSMRTKI